MRKAFLLILALPFSADRLWRAIICLCHCFQWLPLRASHQHQSWARACQLWGGKAAFPYLPTASNQNRDTAHRQERQPVQSSAGLSQREEVKWKVMLTTTKGGMNAPTLWMAAGAEGAPGSSGKRTPRATGHFYSFVFHWIAPEWSSLYLLGEFLLEVTNALQTHFW